MKSCNQSRLFFSIFLHSSRDIQPSLFQSMPTSMLSSSLTLAPPMAPLSSLILILPDLSVSMRLKVQSIRSLQRSFLLLEQAAMNSEQLISFSPWGLQSRTESQLDRPCYQMACSIYNLESFPSPFLSMALKVCCRARLFQLLYLKYMYIWISLESLLLLLNTLIPSITDLIGTRYSLTSFSRDLNHTWARHYLAEGLERYSNVSMEVQRAMADSLRPAFTRACLSYLWARMDCFISLRSLPKKGGFPVSRMQRITPHDQISHFQLQLLFMTSGARQNGVPISQSSMPLLPTEQPKSTSLICLMSLGSLRRRFSGLMSLWTMPLRWQQLMAWSADLIAAQAYCSARLFFLRMYQNSSPPSSSSVTMNMASFVSYSQQTVTMCGWSSCLRILNYSYSCFSQARDILDFDICLTARCCPVLMFFIRQTFPQLPSPRVLTSSQCLQMSSLYSPTSILLSVLSPGEQSGGSPQHPISQLKNKSQC